MPQRFKIDHLWDAAPAEPHEHVSLSLALDAEQLAITVDAPHHADPPPQAAPGPLWRLWEHEVVEVFILGVDERYTEIEMGPHGHHLVLQLQGRRSVTRHSLPLEYSATIKGGRWRATAKVLRALLPDGPHRMNAYAIHGVGERRRHLSLYPVPGPQPDFHRLEFFVALDE